MDRWTLITSDEYTTTTIECIVRSRKSIKQIRKELDDFFIKHRDELLHGNQWGGCSNKKCKVCYPYGYRKQQKQKAMTRHSKVFVPVSVDERFPRRKNKFPETFLTIIEGYEFNPRKELLYADDQFRSDFGKVTHWLEEKENVYVLTEQELKGLLLEFSKEMDTHYGFVIMPDRIYETRIGQFLKSKTNPQTENK